ncbi:DUF6328 family protein [Citricoccus muralis]|uniref:Sodium:proton antiporter n=1 Tax=Citricoccus muralis TaxID=169134 RepID=A0A3D9LEL8_9MICC|nr:DUF6328 family protein [Citricoccus muralis]REE04114.1 hypothetical protein C8E99_1941 [Citricoccus muralis]
MSRAAHGPEPADENASPAQDGESASPETAFRHETPAEKLDRNWSDLLQELRVMQTGTQIVTAFLMTLPFQARFAEVASHLQGWYLALLVTAVLLTVLMLLPVVIHRRFFGQLVKNRTVALGDRVVRICLAGMGLLLAGCVAFIAHVLVATDVAWWITGATALVIAVLMGVLPPLLRPGPRAGGQTRTGPPGGESPVLSR